MKIKNEMKLIIVFLSIVLTSCATMRSYELVKTEKTISSTNIKTKVKEIYETAQKCWSNSPIPIIKMGTKVTQITKDNQFEVIAAWYTHLTGETDPFFKFVITKNGNGVEIAFIERDHYYFQKNSFLSDAKRWSSGDCSCS